MKNRPTPKIAPLFRRTAAALCAAMAALGLAGCGDDGGGGGSEPIDAGDQDAAVSDAPALDVTDDATIRDDTAGDGEIDDTAGDGETDDTGGDVEDDTGNCPLGHPCNPIPISSTPYTDLRDTRDATSFQLDGYSCAADTDESGGEFVYALDLPERSILTAAVDDVSGDAVDVDVHVLTEPAANACLARNNSEVTILVGPGTVFIVVDTWVDGSGAVLAGPYALTVDATPLGSGVCAYEPTDLPMFWTSCADGIDCHETTDPVDGVVRPHLRTPAWGPIVKEAHLVTVGDDGFSGTWPSTATEGLDRHYQLSGAATGYDMRRTEAWAPAGEGGSEYGQGSTGAPIPLIEESWYINMYWRHRPASGTKMLVVNPTNGRAVVAAAGYETGPGSNTAIAGVAEEIHDYLGTGHRSTLQVGFLADQTLPYGPIECP